MIVGRGIDERERTPEGEAALLVNIELPSLGLDGGGLRGAFAAGLLAAVERLLWAHFKTPHTPLGAYFHLLSGTSTGAIIAGGLAKGLLAQDLSVFYQTHGKRIFSKKRVPFLPGRKLRGVKDGAQFDAEPLEKLLTTILSNTPLNALPYPVLATSYAMNSRGRRGPVLFYGGPGYCYPAPLLLKDVIRASTAAPTYFPPAEITTGSLHSFVDGGLAANNPTYLGYLELKRRVRYLHASPSSVRYIILSIGTGLDHRGRDPKTVRESMRAAWIYPPGDLFLVDQMMHAQSMLVDHMLRMHEDVYHYRVDFNLPDAWSSMMDASYLPRLLDMAERIALGKGANNEEKNLTQQLMRFITALKYTKPAALNGAPPPLY